MGIPKELSLGINPVFIHDCRSRNAPGKDFISSENCAAIGGARSSIASALIRRKETRIIALAIVLVIFPFVIFSTSGFKAYEMTNATTNGASRLEIECKNHNAKIIDERDMIIFISLLFLKGISTNKITPNTINGVWKSSVTVNSTPNSTNATTEITISWVLYVFVVDSFN